MFPSVLDREDARAISLRFLEGVAIWATMLRRLDLSLVEGHKG